MSELKARTAQEIVRNEKDCDYMDELFGGVKMPPTQVYLKSEADKVIEELEKNLSEIQSQKMQLEDDVALLRRNNAELKEERRWRKFPDEKPTEDIKFLVINEKGMLQCCYYSLILKEFQIPVTHWMPLPKAPEVK